MDFRLLNLKENCLHFCIFNILNSNLLFFLLHLTHCLAEYQYINVSLEEKQTNKQSIFKLDKLAQKQQLYTITCDTHTNVHTHARRIDSVRRIYSVQRPGLKAGGTLCDSFAIFSYPFFITLL